MSSCVKCGFDNEESDIFCGSCGAFLEWSREPAAARVGVASGASARPEGDGAALEAEAGAGGDPVVEVEDDGIAVEVADPVVEESPPVVETAEETGAPAGAETPAGAEAPGEAGVQAPADAGKAAPADAATTRAEALVVKTPPPGSEPAPPGRTRRPARTAGAAAEAGGDQPAAVLPGAVKPAAPRPRPKPVMAPPTRELQPGDLICGECGEGNVDSRKFCRRCGSSLIDAVAVAPPPVPWWKRPFVRKPRLAAAGERPMRKGGTGARPGAGSRLRTGLRVAGAALAVAVLVAVIGPWRSSLTSAFSSAKRTVKPTFDPVRPVGAEATSAVEAHPASAAIDGISNTYWAEGAPGKGEGQAIVLTFEVPVDIDKVGVLPGASGKPEEFLAQPRPKVLHLIFSDGSTADLELKDSAEFQSFDVEAKAVNRVEVQFASVYSSVDAGQDGSIAELEFFSKR